MIIGTMEATINIDGRTWRFDPTHPIDISIPLNFNGPQPNAYGVHPASSIPCTSGELVGDTRNGGSCNFEQYTLIPHCNGTHTECVGHITSERMSIRDCLNETLIPAFLTTVAPERAAESRESYSMAFGGDDIVITRGAIAASLREPTGEIGALVVRTKPNDETKLTKTYDGSPPAYFTTDAIELIVELGVRHLLVDLPSIDRLYDEGRLSNHRTFWNVRPGRFETNAGTRTEATITELVYVPDEIADGTYLLNLQIAPFASDASPSRPLLFPVLKK